jgi:hypothetical protein
MPRQPRGRARTARSGRPYGRYVPASSSVPPESVDTGPRDHRCGDAGCSRAPHWIGGLDQRYARRDQIVNEQHVRTCDRCRVGHHNTPDPPVATCGRCVAAVLQATVRQPSMDARRADRWNPKAAGDGPCEDQGVVRPALPSAAWIGRHRHDHIDTHRGSMNHGRKLDAERREDLGAAGQLRLGDRGRHDAGPPRHCDGRVDRRTSVPACVSRNVGAGAPPARSVWTQRASDRGTRSTPWWVCACATPVTARGNEEVEERSHTTTLPHTALAMTSGPPVAVDSGAVSRAAAATPPAGGRVAPQRLPRPQGPPRARLRRLHRARSSPTRCRAPASRATERR